MEKVVLSNGSEFQLVANGVSASPSKVSFVMLPGEETAESLLNLFNGESEFTVKNGETSISVYRNYTLCNSVQLLANYVVDTIFVCPVCGAQVAPDATECTECGATFEAPDAQFVTENVCRVENSVPDLNARVTDVEDAVEDIIATIIE